VIGNIKYLIPRQPITTFLLRSFILSHWICRHKILCRLPTISNRRCH